jgi:hypothetical protein
MTDTIIVKRVEYTDTAAIDYDETDGICNHDELVNQGKTRDIAICLPDNEYFRQSISEDEIIQPEDDGWREEFADLGPNDTIPLE